MNEQDHKLMDEIAKLTSQIQALQPAVYKNLEETPLFSEEKKTKMTTKDLEDYRETLKTQLQDLLDKKEKDSKTPNIHKG